MLYYINIVVILYSMQERIINIIQKLPIIQKIKDALIENIDVIDTKQLLEILSKYAKKREDFLIKEKQKAYKVEKLIHNFEMLKETQDEEKELSGLIDQLEYIYN